MVRLVNQKGRALDFPYNIWHSVSTTSSRNSPQALTRLIASFGWSTVTIFVSDQNKSYHDNADFGFSTSGLPLRLSRGSVLVSLLRFCLLFFGDRYFSVIR